MRTQTTTRDLYQFEELSKSAQRSALSKLWDLNVSYDWWDFIYEDAKMIECEIDGFDIDRGQSINFTLEGNLREVCEAILKNHGEMCETHKLAKKTLNRLDVNEALYEIFSDLAQEQPDDCDFEHPTWNDLLWDKARDYECECEDMTEEFRKDLGYLYLKMLSDGFDWYTSDEAIEESIISNEYEFDIDGNLS